MLFNAEMSATARVTSSPEAEASSYDRKRTREEYRNKWNPQKQSLVTIYFDRNREWVLVPNGSYMGYFDWVPVSLRKGPWSPLAYVNLIGVGIMLGISYWHNYFHSDGGSSVSLSPNNEEEVRLLVSKERPTWSGAWLYNIIACLWMSIVFVRMLRATSTFILCTYTIQSWVAQTLRHFLAVLLPLVQHYKYQSLLLPITVLYRRLRFHVLFSASVTFLIWNFILFPYVYLVAFRNKPSQRQKFMRWNFSFHLQQIHLCNIIFAYLNTVVYDHLDHRVSMDTMDLWVASFCIWMYSLFYLLILDRYGIHLYPIFSPRSHWGMALSGTLIWGILYLTFLAWNTWLRRRHF